MYIVTRVEFDSEWDSHWKSDLLHTYGTQLQITSDITVIAAHINSSQPSLAVAWSRLSTADVTFPLSFGTVPGLSWPSHFLRLQLSTDSTELAYCIRNHQRGPIRQYHSFLAGYWPLLSNGCCIFAYPAAVA
jgi:hypothetical protein